MSRIRRYAIPRKSKKGKTKWFARVAWTLPDGTERSREKAANSKTHARALADQMAGKLEHDGVTILDAEKITFRDLAEAYKAAKVTEAIYDGEIKVAGMRAKREAEIEVDQLVKYWGDSLLQKITHPDLEAYKLHLIKEPVIFRYWEKGALIEKPRKEPRSIASVNHRLRRMRAMLNFAKRKKWLRSNPFNEGEPLISEAAETPRDRAPRPGELERLLAACHGRRSHMRAFILCLVDTGLRVSEARKLTRADIDLAEMVITARARVTKTNRPRFVPITERLAAEMRPLIEQAADGPIFGDFAANKSAWNSIRKEAGSEDLQLRDLRHWNLSETAEALAAAGLPWQHGMATSGHTQIKTYLRYLNKDQRPAREAGKALEDFRRQRAEEPDGDSGEWVN
jgi:integrase